METPRSVLSSLSPTIIKDSIFAKVSKCKNLLRRGVKKGRMAKTRALLTETEQEQVAGGRGDSRKYQAASRVQS